MSKSWWTRDFNYKWSQDDKRGTKDLVKRIEADAYQIGFDEGFDEAYEQFAPPLPPSVPSKAPVAARLPSLKPIGPPTPVPPQSPGDAITGVLGTNSQYGSSGDTVYYLHQGMPAPYHGHTSALVLSAAEVLGGWRSCIFSPMQKSLVQKYRHGLSLHEGSLHPEDMDTGTRWAMRLHGLSGCQITASQFFDIGGGSGPISSKQEGHALYWTISPRTGDLFQMVDCGFWNLAGHAVYLNTTWEGPGANTGRYGNAPLPEWGAELRVKNCVFRNTDQGPGRGSNTFELNDTHLDMVIENTNIIYDENFHPGEGYTLKSRGAFKVRGPTGHVTLRNCKIVCPDPCSKTYPVSVRGAKSLTLENCVLDCKAVGVNEGFHNWAELHQTRKLTMKGCTGRAEVFIGDNHLGAAELEGSWDILGELGDSWEEA